MSSPLGDAAKRAEAPKTATGARPDAIYVDMEREQMRRICQLGLLERYWADVRSAIFPGRGDVSPSVPAIGEAAKDEQASTGPRPPGGSTGRKSRKPRGETTCERLRQLHQEDPDFAETAPLREVGRRIGRRAGTIHESKYYKTVLKSRREEVLAVKKRARAAKQWWHCDSTGEWDETLENL